MTITVGPGIGIGGGITLTSSVLVTTGLGQNVTGVPNAQGFFFAVLNRSEPGWDTFAANGNNGSWTATGDFGSGTATVPVLSVPQDADSVYPIVSGGQFQPGLFYTFSGY
jgi:hypothetical protein